jgi:hypothetical protein
MPVLANRPVIRKAARAAVEAVVDAVRERRQGPVTAAVNEATVTAAAINIAEQPALVNALNAEPWYASRIKVGLIITLAGWIAGRFGWVWDLNEGDVEIISNVLMAFGGSMAGVGRWISGLPPMRLNPLTWFGLDRLFGRKK